MQLSRLRSVRPLATRARHMSASWSAVPQGPPDAILGLVEAFNKDPSPTKYSLSVGAYRTDEGKPWVLPSVREAESRVLAANMNKEYAGIGGVDDFVGVARSSAFTCRLSTATTSLPALR